MGVIFEKVDNAADRILDDAEYIARQDDRDIFNPARNKLRRAFSILLERRLLEFTIAPQKDNYE